MKYQLIFKGEWNSIFSMLGEFEKIARKETAESIRAIYMKRAVPLDEQVVENYAHLFNRLHTTRPVPANVLDHLIEALIRPKSLSFVDYEQITRKDKTTRLEKEDETGVLSGKISRKDQDSVLKYISDEYNQTFVSPPSKFIPFRLDINSKDNADSLLVTILIRETECAINMIAEGEFLNSTKYIVEGLNKYNQQRRRKMEYSVAANPDQK